MGYMKIRDVTIYQKPNAPLLISATFWLVARFSQGTLKEYFSLLFIGTMLWWSYLEITSGVNYFRRILGVVIAVLMLRSGYIILNKTLVVMSQ